MASLGTHILSDINEQSYLFKNLNIIILAYDMIVFKLFLSIFCSASLR